MATTCITAQTPTTRTTIIMRLFEALSPRRARTAARQATKPQADSDRAHYLADIGMAMD